jgi:hypothetical protein
LNLDSFENSSISNNSSVLFFLKFETMAGSGVRGAHGSDGPFKLLN